MIEAPKCKACGYGYDHNVPLLLINLDTPNGEWVCMQHIPPGTEGAEIVQEIIGIVEKQSATIH